jgi:hypothetical protein
MPYSAMLRRVADVTTDVSEERTASIIRVTLFLRRRFLSLCDGGGTFLRNMFLQEPH